MKGARRYIAVVVLAACGTGSRPRMVLAEDRFPLYVGQIVCAQCHVTDAGATTRATAGDSAAIHLQAPACSEPPAPRHNRSYATLNSESGQSIALINGVVESPWQSRICLSCHSTGADEGERWMAPGFQMVDGVQCEACHGPGSTHVELMSRPQRERPGAGERAIRRSSRSDCAVCHVERPSHREVLVRGFRPAPADREYKSPVDLVLSPDGSRLYVVCRQSNSVVEVDVVKRQVLREVAVGKRPLGIAIEADGQRLFVSNRFSNAVSVIDVRTFQITATIAVGAEPHGVLVGPGGRFLYVANTGEDTISVIDRASGEEVRRLSAGRGPWSMAADHARGCVMLTNVRPALEPFLSPPCSEVSVIDDERGIVRSRPRADAANMLEGVAVDPFSGAAIFTLMRSKNLVPLTRLAQGWVITNGLGVLWPDGRLDQLLLDTPNHAYPDLTDIAISPDGRRALVTSGGANEVVVVDLSGLLHALRSAPESDRRNVWPNHLGRGSAFIVASLPVGTNPQGIVMTKNGRRAFVANTLDDTVGVIALDDESVRLDGTIPLGGPKETSRLRHGERLFHSAANTFGRQFSCRSCHPDGHVNGLTFDIEADGIGLKPVDNRTLQGIFDTPPFKWEGLNPTLHRQCGPRLSVFFTRLQPLSPDNLNDLVQYMCTIERPPNRHREPEGLTVAQRRGKAVFERVSFNDGSPIPPAQRCNTCHHGAYFTNRTTVPVATAMWLDAWLDVDLSDFFQTDEFGELGSYYFIDAGLPPAEFDVPHLTNIVQGAPYLHNGAARTLEEIWTRFNITDGHGATADLTRQQFNDLIAYLKSL